MSKHEGMPDPEKIKEILDVVSEKIPGLLKELSSLLYSPQSAKQYAEAAKSVSTENKELRERIEDLEKSCKMLERILIEWARGIIILTAQLQANEIPPRWKPATDPQEFLDNIHKD